MTDAILVWQALSRGKQRVVTRDRVVELARRIDLNPASAVRTLVRNNRIIPTFKGYYYVKDPGEVLHNRADPLRVFAHAAKAKNIGFWYYGLYSALRMHGMSHEYRNQEYVISTDLYRPNGVTLADRRFTVLKWRPALARFGVTRRGPYAASDPEKTVLDFVYWDHYRQAKGHAPSLEWRDHIDSINPDRLASYLPKYPPGVRSLVEDHL